MYKTKCDIVYIFCRPSPKLVLIILQLCRVALPLMTADSCDRVDLPTWGSDVSVSYPPDVEESDAKSVKIASLLLAKLGDFLTPGTFVLFSKGIETNYIFSAETDWPY